MDLCKPYVEGSDTKLCPVCDFPFGTSSTESKIAQAKILVDNYADVIGELDVVANFGWIRSGLYDKVTEDIKQSLMYAMKRMSQSRLSLKPML